MNAGGAIVLLGEAERRKMQVIRKDGEGMAGVGPMLVRTDAFTDAVAAFEKRYGPS